MSFISRGFHRRNVEPGQEGRVPPGQHVVSDFPVLSAGADPAHQARELDVSARGEIDAPPRLDLGLSSRRSRARPSRRTSTASPSWTKLDTNWEGVSRRHAARRRRDERRVRRSRSATAATRPTSRSRTSPAARPGSRPATTASRSRPSTAGRRGCSSHTSTSGRAQVGARAAAAATTTSRASGRATATTTTATRGWSSVTAATELAVAEVVERDRGDAARRRPRPRRARLDRPPARASTSTSGSRPRTATRRSAATRSPPRPRTASSRSRSSAWTTARSRPISSTSCAPATSSSCAGRSAATSCGTPRSGGPLLLVAGGSGIVRSWRSCATAPPSGARWPCACSYVVAHARRTSSTRASSSGSGLDGVESCTR